MKLSLRTRKFISAILVFIFIMVVAIILALILDLTIKYLGTWGSVVTVGVLGSVLMIVMPFSTVTFTWPGIRHMLGVYVNLVVILLILAAIGKFIIYGVTRVLT